MTHRNPRSPRFWASESGALLHGTEVQLASGNPAQSYRTREPVKVLEELVDWVGHSPEQLQAMREGLPT